MDTNSRWKYILLGVGAFLVVIVLVYFRVAAYLNVPVVSLLPFTKNVSIPSPTPGVKVTSVERMTFADNRYIFEVRGKFAAKPYYQDGLLWGEFIIDEDPYNISVPVIMGGKGGKINVGRSKGSFSGETVWKLEDTGVLLTAIKPGEPARLRIQIPSPIPSKQDPIVRSTLEGIMSGNWSISQNFYFIPVMVGVVE